MSIEDYDYLVIGSGLAGLTFALRASAHGRVGLLTKAELFESNTSYAQGGIAAAVGETDSWRLHETDTLIAGGEINDRAAVRHLVQEAPAAIEWLIEIGARFDQADGAGAMHQLTLGREGGHSRHRIVHHADNTGWEIERAVTEAVRQNPNILIRENAFVTDLMAHEGRVSGALAVLPEVGPRVFRARQTFLATGGCGRMYRHTTNPRIATADGIALADRVGAEITGMEFMQFHPTTLYHEQLRNFLITEAVRGAGALLRNHEGTRFMYDYDARLELAPRDVVSRAIDAEIKRLETWCVYLDLTHLEPSDIHEHFPTIEAKLRGIGIEMHKHWIPVVPAQHYSCGGVVTDLDGHTTVPGLLAAGEVTWTGVHGANRLASNSLLEALVFAAAAADWCADHEREVPVPIGPAPDLPRCMPETDAVHLRRRLQKLMTQHVGIVRSDAGLATAQRTLSTLQTEYANRANAPFDIYSAETKNLLDAAHHVVQGALRRRENIGLHFNTDLVSVHAETK